MATKARTFLGSAATDIITSGAVLQFVQLTSYFVRFNLNALDGTSRRFFQWGDASIAILTLEVATGCIDFIATVAVWPSGYGDWTTVAPSIGAEHDLVIAYDAGLPTNKPVIFLDGVQLAVTTVTTPIGTPVFTDSRPISLGNRLDGLNRVLSGTESTFAIWKGVLLGPDDAKMLHIGTGPESIKNNFLAYHDPLDNGESPEPDIVSSNNGTVTGTTVGTAPGYLYDRRGLRLLFVSTTGVCSTSASLTTSVKLLAALSGVCVTNAAMITVNAMSASAFGISTDGATALTTLITMSGSVSCGASTLGSMSTGSQFIASAICTCSTMLSTGNFASTSSGTCATSARERFLGFTMALLILEPPVVEHNSP
jgi:hypothetical protein